MPKNLLQKKDDELDKLKTAGLGATNKGIIQACQKAKRHGYILSCMIILGLGGRTYSNEHIHDTARIVSEVTPDYLGALTLYLDDRI
jgi:hypothetical protein